MKFNRALLYLILVLLNCLLAEVRHQWSWWETVTSVMLLLVSLYWMYRGIREE